MLAVILCGPKNFIPQPVCSWQTEFSHTQMGLGTESGKAHGRQRVVTKARIRFVKIFKKKWGCRG